MQFNPDITYFGQTNFRNQRRNFGIKADDRRRHMYVIGKTGMGKSEMIKNMAIQDIHNGRGIAVVDPHGELVEDILNAVPPQRINDVVYFNPADADYPIAFNILESVDEPHEKNLVASGLIGIFKKLWAESWGPRLEYLLRNAILALLDYPGSTLLGVTRILVDKEYRQKVVDKISDPVVKSFWTQEYPKYSQQFQVEAISPIQNKVGQFLSLALIRNIVGQVKSTIDLRQIMDNRKILLLNLSKGRIGEDASALLGAMMITKMQLAAMGRVDIPESERQDFYLYVDEFQNFVTNSFADILSEARKYRLNLIVAHQYIAQLTTSDSTKVRDAVFGNVGTIVTFRVGAEDAEFLAKEFAPTFDETDLVNLAKYDVYLKLMIDGIASTPFSASTLPPLPKDQDSKDKIIKVSRERYAVQREVIEDKIARWAGFGQEETIHALPKQDVHKSEKPQARREEKTQRKTSKQTRDMRTEQVMQVEGFVSVCSNCGKETEVKFKPDGKRPVFCPDCLKLFKQGKLKRNSHQKQGSVQRATGLKSAISPSDRRVVEEDVIIETPAEVSLAEALGGMSLETSTERMMKTEQAISQQIPSITVVEKTLNNEKINKSVSEPDEEHLIQPGEVIKF